MAKLLVIDDSLFESKHLMSLLQEQGHEVVCAETGALGMKMIKIEHPDLILLDLVLPDISGREICRWAKMNSDTQMIPIIILTSRADVKERVAGLQEGANDYITKPFDDLELKARIAAVLREKLLRDELQKKNTEYEDLLRKFEKMAVTDTVTGLYNRRRFDEVLTREFERFIRYEVPFSCLMIDVDHFKTINDTYGHDVGDVVLRGIAKTIQKQIRTVDTVARYGGDEFVVLLTQQKKEDAEKVALRIIKQLRQQTFEEIDKNGEKVTVSIGITSVPDPDLKNKEQVVHGADYALYKAKKKGRDCFQTASIKEARDADNMLIK